MAHSGPLMTERWSGCCMILEGELALAWCPSRCKTWGDDLSGRSMLMIWSRLLCWCLRRPRHWRASGALPETSVETGSRLHNRAPPSWTDLYAAFNFLLPGPRPLQRTGAQLSSPPQPWLEASLKIGPSKSDTRCDWNRCFWCIRIRVLCVFMSLPQYQTVTHCD